ncbi:MAG: LLM class flavin-dependent oxidoreductase [Rhizobacter sp.]
MTTEFIWQLPTSGDGRLGHAPSTRRGERAPGAGSPYQDGVTDPRGNRFNFFDYIHQVARAADLGGFDGVQIQHDLHGDESWIVAGVIARSTRHLKLLTEFDAARGSAVYAAKNAASYQRYSGGRFAWQISTVADAALRRQQADTVADSDQLLRIDEFLTVAKGVLTTAPYSFKGRFFEVLDGGFKGPLSGQVVPPVYLSGESEEALALSAKHADVHVLPALPPKQLSAAVARVQSLAALQGRSVKIGLRIDVVARETEDEARHDVQRTWAQLGRKQDLRAIDPALSPQLWPPVTPQTGARAALVGSYTQVTERLHDYAQLGVQSFILAAVPQFEEAYRFGEHVLPALRERLGEQSQTKPQAA